MINEDILLQATHPSGAEWQVRGEALTHTNTITFPSQSSALTDMPNEALSSGLVNENCRIVQQELASFLIYECESELN